VLLLLSSWKLTLVKRRGRVVDRITDDGDDRVTNAGVVDSDAVVVDADRTVKCAARYQIPPYLLLVIVAVRDVAGVLCLLILLLLMLVSLPSLLLPTLLVVVVVVV
jgi:hypothetical protein